MPAEEVRSVDVLLVEDNEPDVRLAREALREAKVHTNLHVAYDGVEALTFLRQQGEHAGAPRPDLVLLDLNLPRKDGRAVLAEINADAELASIPVIVLTTSDAEQDILRSYRLAANAYITKPIDLNELIAVVRSIETFWLSIVRLPAS